MERSKNPMYAKYKYIGESIKQIRKMQKLTQKELSKISGFSQSRISNYEKGFFLPRFDAVLTLANALGVQYQDILGFELKPSDLGLYQTFGINPDIYENEENEILEFKRKWEGFEQSEIDFMDQLQAIGKRTAILPREPEDLNFDLINDALHDLNYIGLSKVYDYIQDIKNNEKYTKKA